MKTSIRFSLLVALASGWTACEAPPVVPKEPTWVDVEPIFRGQCNHCHGRTADVTGGTFRLDVFDSSDARCGEVASTMKSPIDGSFWANRAVVSVKPDEGARPRMPPSPASTLEDWEVEMLTKYTASKEKLKDNKANKKPTITLMGKLPDDVDNELEVNVIAGDPDDHGVVGFLKLGDEVVDLPGPGLHTVKFNTSMVMDGDELTLRGGVCDSWANTVRNLGTVTVKR
jgi:hypothetical protein